MHFLHFPIAGTISESGQTAKRSNPITESGQFFSKDLSPPPVDNDIVAVSATRGKSGSSPPEIFKIIRVLRRKNVVRQENSSPIHHASDIGHGQRLLKAVVVDQHICSDHQVQTLARREVQSLSDN